METIVNPDVTEAGHQQTAEIETSTGAVSVVHVTTIPDQGIQVISPGDEEEPSLSEKDLDSKKRREFLARRPSYRHILNDLSSTDSRSIITKIEQTSDSEEEVATNLSTQAFTGIPIQTAGLLQGSQIKLLPAQTIQLATEASEASPQGLQTLTMTNVPGGSTSNTSSAGNSATAPTIVQYAQSADGQFLIPAGNIQYQLAGTTASLPQGVVVASTGSSSSPQTLSESAMQKRELRLLKNKEAARECRRKKKEYVKCLENRVAVLENQNKTLIEELKSLKELYCQKDLGQS